MTRHVLGVLERGRQPFGRVLVVSTVADLRPSEDGVPYRSLVRRPAADGLA